MKTYRMLSLIMLVALLLGACGTAAPANDLPQVTSQENGSQPDYAGKKILWIDHQGYSWTDDMESGMHEVLDGTVPN